MIYQLAIKILESRPPIYLNSIYRHDYLSYKFQDGTSIFIDGGNSLCDGGYYYRSSGPLDILNKSENYTLTDKDSFKTIKKKLLWGTRGKSGKEPLTYRPLIELETDHLKAILKTQKSSEIHLKVIKSILADRAGGESMQFPDGKLEIIYKCRS